MVGFTVAPKMLVYFDGLEGTIDGMGNEQISNPDVNRMSTNKDGLYAGIDFDAGSVTVSALAQISGTLQSLGTFRVNVVADSVSILSFKGARPVVQR